MTIPRGTQATTTPGKECVVVYDTLIGSNTGKSGIMHPITRALREYAPGHQDQIGITASVCVGVNGMADTVVVVEQVDRIHQQRVLHSTANKNLRKR